MGGKDGDAERVRLDADVVWHPPGGFHGQPLWCRAANVCRRAEDRAGAVHEAHASVVKEDSDPHVRVRRGGDYPCRPAPPGGGV